MDRTHYYIPVDLDAALEKSVLIGKDYSGPAKLWMRLTEPAAKDE
jgi:hypothetical protein